jgi:hypothetical protein
MPIIRGLSRYAEGGIGHTFICFALLALPLSTQLPKCITLLVVTCTHVHFRRHYDAM